MTTVTKRRSITVVLLGNPNTGKSTLFSALVGVRQRTGNYPGVTVEKKIGKANFSGNDLQIVDLPGTYSLAPHSPDEMVAVDILLGRRNDVPPPDIAVCIVDASNLTRNLYLVSQVLEIGIPTVIALNMMDVAERKEIDVDVERLQTKLGVPVVPIQANRQLGLEPLKKAILEASSQEEASDRSSPLPSHVQEEVSALQELSSQSNASPLPRYLVERLLLDTGYLESAPIAGVDDGFREELQKSRARLTDNGQSLVVVEATARYQWAGEVTHDVVKHGTAPRSLSDRLDAVLTHRLWGTLIFALMMIIIFQSVFSWASWFMDGISLGLEWLGAMVSSAVPEGALQSLLVNGVIAGVGGVLVFLPQIFILFLFIAVLEDCGYMARAAYLMDRLMSRIGLSGKSFIPLLSSFACAIPGIMAARVIENRRDRLVTIMIAPLMSCSARLPVYALLIAAFIPETPLIGNVLGLQGLTLFVMYILGMVVAVVVAVLLKRTILPGETPPFVMELPSYKIPDARVVLFRMLDRGWAFVRRAGTLIFAVTILVWAAGYFPHRPEPVADLLSQQAGIEQQIQQLEATETPDQAAQIEVLQEQLTQVENEIAGVYMRNSFMGQAGQFIEPVVAPLGWDWRIGCAVIASFPAREVVVGTLGVIYNLGEDEGTVSLQKSLQNATWDGTDQPVFNIPVALSIMVFFALCAQCVSTLAIVRRETNSWGWTVFSFTYMTVIAYVAALVTYQVGSWWIS